MVARFCTKCKMIADMTKRIIAEGTSKECITWWCPNCKDQISNGASSFVQEKKHG